MRSISTLTKTHVCGHALRSKFTLGIIALKFGDHRRHDRRCGITLVLSPRQYGPHNKKQIGPDYHGFLGGGKWLLYDCIHGTSPRFRFSLEAHTGTP